MVCYAVRSVPLVYPFFGSGTFTRLLHNTTNTRRPLSDLSSAASLNRLFELNRRGGVVCQCAGGAGAADVPRSATQPKPPASSGKANSSEPAGGCAIPGCSGDRDQYRRGSANEMTGGLRSVARMSCAEFAGSLDPYVPGDVPCTKIIDFMPTIVILRAVFILLPLARCPL